MTTLENPTLEEMPASTLTFVDPTPAANRWVLFTNRLLMGEALDWGTNTVKTLLAAALPSPRTYTVIIKGLPVHRMMKLDELSAWLRRVAPAKYQPSLQLKLTETAKAVSPINIMNP